MLFQIHTPVFPESDFLFQQEPFLFFPTGHKTSGRIDYPMARQRPFFRDLFQHTSYHTRTLRHSQQGGNRSVSRHFTRRNFPDNLIFLMTLQQVLYLFYNLSSLSLLTSGFTVLRHYPHPAVLSQRLLPCKIATVISDVLLPSPFQQVCRTLTELFFITFGKIRRRAETDFISDFRYCHVRRG